jgi:hypothetical protein
MVLKRVVGGQRSGSPPFSARDSTYAALNSLYTTCRRLIPPEVANHIQNVVFTNSTTHGADDVYFPCPLKELEAAAAIKALEACVAASISDVRYGARPRVIEVDMAKTACFLMSAYMTTIDGKDKGDPDVKSRIPGT